MSKDSEAYKNSDFHKVSDLSDELILTHYAENSGNYYHAVTPPVCLSSLHVYDSVEAYFAQDPARHDQFVYGRTSNPTATILERKIAALERGERALVFASGMAACTAAIFATCDAGDHIICMRDVYQPVKRYLNGYGIPHLHYSVSYLTGTDLNEIEAAIRPNTKLMILESPASLVFTVVDLAGIAAIAKAHGIKTYIDNTCCTPLNQRPLELGIDLVMHTMSKYFGGHSDIIGGVLVSKDEELMLNIMRQEREWFGGILGPMEAWLTIRGLRSLQIRLKQHQENALACAQFLETHPKIQQVYYTGLASHPQADLIKKQMSGHGGLLSVLVKGEADAGVRFANGLKLFGKGCSWGGFESLALMPLYQSTEEELEFLDMQGKSGLLRLYCGLEGAENLVADLSQALEHI